MADVAREIRIHETVLRYLLYLGFVLAAVAFWLLFLLFFMWPQGDPHACIVRDECVERSLVARIVTTMLLWLAMPLTALAFVLYRKLVRRLFPPRQ